MGPTSAVDQVQAINIVRIDAWLTGTPLGPTRIGHLTQIATENMLKVPA